MRLSGRRRKSTAFFITLGSCLVALAVALNVGWILLNWREVAMLVLGIIFFGVIIAGLVLNTTFLVREIRRNEQHDAFLNAATHELQTTTAARTLPGLLLNPTFLVREIRRNEQHDAFINAVTHELKTPIASIRLYLETLQKRDLPEEKRLEFYNLMLGATAGRLAV